MNFLFIKLLVFSIHLFSHVNAWHLDKSCEKLGYGNMVREGMTSAIDLAQAAADTMQALKDQTYSEAQMDLFEYMFSFAVKKVDRRRQIDPSAWNWINRIFVQVLKFKPLRDGKEAEDVVIYCDYSRYIEGTQCNGDQNKKMACDKDTSEDVDINSAFNWCKSKSGYFPVMGLTSSNGVSNFAQMDLCAWYLKFMTTSKKQYWFDLGSKSLLAWPIHKIYNVTLLRTKMDAAALLDHTILHELTHAIPLRATTDTSNFFSYGWKRCVSLGKSRDSGINNADNYAYFALGARMINPNNGKAPMRPMKNGSIKPLSSQSQRRSISPQDEPESEDTVTNLTSLGTSTMPTSAHESIRHLANQTRTVSPTTFTRSVHHLPLNTTSNSLSLSAFQNGSLTAALLPPEARTRNPDDKTFKMTSADVPLTSSTGIAAPTGLSLISSGHDSNQTFPSPTLNQTNHSTSKSLDPSPTSHNVTQDPTPGGIRPTPASEAQLHTTSIGPSNHTDPPNSSTPNITSPIPSSIRTSTTNLPSPITSSRSNFTTELATPITVFPITNADTSTSITYIATNTVDANNQPTDVWKCQGDLCDTSSSRSCIIPAFCADEPDLGPSWGLCCAFVPIPVPGGAALLPGGPPSPPVIGPPAPPGPPGPPAGGGGGSGSNSNSSDDKDDDNDKDKNVHEDEKNTYTSDSTTSLSTTESSQATSAEATSATATSSSKSPTSTSEAKTCTQTATASTCTMTISIFTPTATGTSTPTPETKTIKTCKPVPTVNECPPPVSTTVTTITASTTDATASPIEHYWDWDGQHNWLEVQQSILEGLETASPSASITTTETTSESAASVPASITAIPTTSTTSPERITVTRDPPTTTAPSVTTTDPAPIIAVITLPTTLVTLRKYLCTPSFDIWRDPQWLCYCPRTTSSSSTTLFVPLITNNLCRYTSIPDPLPSMSISYSPKRFATD